MSKLYIFIKPFMAAMIVSIAIKGIGAVTDILIPLYLGKVIDEGIVPGDMQTVINLCIIMLVLTVLTVAFNLWANFISSRATQGIGEALRNSLYEKIQALTIKDVDQLQTPSLITRITGDVEQVQRTLLMTTRVIIRAPILALGGIILSLMIDVQLTCIIFAAMAVIGFLSVFIYRAARPYFRKIRQNVDRLTSILRESLAGVRVIKSFDKAEHEIERFDEQSGQVRANELKAGTYLAFVSSTIALTNGVTVAALLFASHWRILGAGLTIGEVVTIINYVNQILMAVSQVPRIFMLFSRANISAARINEIMEIDETTDYGKEASPLDETKTLSLENISFSYPKSSARALENISFTVAKGETVAVIGGTGAGKTTLLNLILRLYEPKSGTITLQGRDIRSYTKNYLHDTVTAALQQYNIFAMSIKENITLDRPHDGRRLERSAGAAQIMDFVESVEGRFDYKITQIGSNISGGQKQRLSVARTLYREAALTVLDDVSSALDYQTDLRLRAALKDAYMGKSVLIISQRVSSVKTADKIIVLHGGKVHGTGTHEELIQNCAVYRDICRTQNIEIIHNA
ncbi:MAG: ABC transporter ATP-binding protein/permease [Oscillospiraceae bacterium]|nr:ABC transporter ATP-binding protein/permease [Oscillospiraceae bacterium]